MMKPKLMLFPLMLWSTKTFHIGRQEGISDERITECVKIYAKAKGWQPDQITKVLRRNGIPPRKLNPLKIICPKCNEVGKIQSFSNSWLDRKWGTNGRLHYVVVHEPMKGKWGKTKPGKRRNTWGKSRLQKRRRCFYHYLFDHPDYVKEICNQLFPISGYTD